MNPAFAPGLLSRVEDAGINASAPREQLWVDGWLVRFSPGKAKRARCVQAVAAGRMSLDERLARCLAVYAGAGLQPYFRITPFSQPAGLDEQLAARGMERIDDTRVMVASLDARRAGPRRQRRASRRRCRSAPSTATPSPSGSACSAARRPRRAPPMPSASVSRRCAIARSAWSIAAGQPMVGGQVVVEGELAGLYDIFSVEAMRGRGLARALCRELLQVAAADGARVAYLQVEASNAPARRVYERLGFADAYAYHYRSPPAG